MVKVLTINRGKFNPNKNRQNSIWHYDPPTPADKLTNIVTTLTKFRQADFTSLAKGGAEIVCVSLCGLEKGFVMNKLGTSLPGDVVGNLVTGMGINRINHVQAMTDYFTDLELEYDFISNWMVIKSISKEGGTATKLSLPLMKSEKISDPDIKTIFVILTIEGGHVFNAGLQMMGKTANPQEVLANVDKVKQWDKRLFFMGLTHHFDNELVGQAQSLHGIVRKMCDQSDNLNEGFSELGSRCCVNCSTTPTTGGCLST